MRPRAAINATPYAMRGAYAGTIRTSGSYIRPREVRVKQYNIGAVTPTRRSFLASLTAAALARGAQPPLRPKVAGTLTLRARRRSKTGAVSEQVLNWDVARTAIIICDMWDTHTCSSAAQRVATMAP